MQKFRYSDMTCHPEPKYKTFHVMFVSAHFKRHAKLRNEAVEKSFDGPEIEDCRWRTIGGGEPEPYAWKGPLARRGDALVPMGNMVHKPGTPSNGGEQSPLIQGAAGSIQAGNDKVVYHDVLICIEATSDPLRAKMIPKPMYLETKFQYGLAVYDP
ncbi:unnamed protein product [Calypogeia fissa]